MQNVIDYGSEKLAKLYNDVFSAKLKALTLAIKRFLEISKLFKEIYGKLKVVAICDNKAAVLTINNEKEPHPFASEFVDFLRQICEEKEITCKWVPTDQNLADCLTKAKKWY